MNPFPSWRAGWRKPDRRSIHAWLHDNWHLPASYSQPGRFDVRTSRHLIAPFDAVQDDSVREVSMLAAIQTAKTLVIEGSIGWATVNSPGPMMWTLQTDDDAKEHCNQRFMEGYKSIPAIKEIWPVDRHMATMTEVYYGPFFLAVNGANLNNLQRVSIRWKFNSEVWLWKQGLLSHARGRISAFEKAGNAKMVNESQGGTAGDDFDEAWKAGNQQVWSIRCSGCSRLVPLEFEGRATTDPTKRACVVWNDDARRQDGSWNVGRAAETVRWMCPHCGREYEDTSKTRALWNADGDYVVGRLDAPANNKSFRWEALVSREMGALVAQFLEARRQQKQGVFQAMMDFTRQRRALPWKDEQSGETITLSKSGFLLIGVIPLQKLTDEASRVLSIDCQKDHYWCTVSVLYSDGGMRLIYRSRINTEEQLEEVRKNYGVEPQLAFIDSGYFPTRAYAACAKYGWTALKGSGDNSFGIEIKVQGGTKKIRRMWSNVTQVYQDGKLIPLIHWASDPIKDVLHNLRKGQGARFEIPDDAGEDFERQMNGDRKKQTIVKKTGKPEWRWFRVHDNHYWDCMAQTVTACLMLGLLANPEVPEDDKKDETPITNG